MNAVIKELLISVGGGSVVVVALLVFLKPIVQKIADQAIENSFERNTIRFSNSVERATRAYELLIGKEFEFYEKIDSPLATLVTLIQDIKSYATEPHIYSNTDIKEKYRESLVKYLEIILNTKNEILLHQVYIPDNIFKATSKLMSVLQDDAELLCNTYDSLRDGKTDEINIEKIEEATEKILLSVAAVETVIKTRLENLSSVDEND